MTWRAACWELRNTTKWKNGDPKAKRVTMDKKVCRLISMSVVLDVVVAQVYISVFALIVSSSVAVWELWLLKAETYRYSLLWFKSCSNWPITSQSLEPHQLEEGRRTAELLVLIVLVQTHWQSVYSRPQIVHITLQSAAHSPASTTWSMVGKRLQTAVLTERKMSSDVRLT